MSSLMQYLIQQTQDFHNRVDEVNEVISDLQDKIAVTEYNILRELRYIRQELSELYIEEEDNDNNKEVEDTGG